MTTITTILTVANIIVTGVVIWQAIKINRMTNKILADARAHLSKRMFADPDITKQIDKIHEEYYNGFRGTMMQDLGSMHTFLRGLIGDEEYLRYIQERMQKNPKPTFSFPTTKTTPK